MRSPTDPAADADADTTLRAAEATAHRLAGELFPWDLTRALELALLKTFCVPSISGLLARTGEFEQRPRKRYDDTGLMVAELLRHGLDSPAGAAVIERMNRIHGHYAIGNDDFLYVLSTFVAEPIRWLARYGWRPLTPLEQEHLFLFWRGVGERMGIAALPPSLADLLALNERVEREAFAPAATNRRIADATLAMLLADWPAALRPALRRGLLGLLDRQTCAALGWSTAPDWLQALVLQALRARSRAAALVAGGRARLGRPAPARFYSQQPTPSYGATFRLEQLGPPPLLANLALPAPPALAKQEGQPPSRQPMAAPFQSPHFALVRTEDGWILEARVTKDLEGDWLLSRHELEELHGLLERVIAS
ncbi:oxygenase MpaB family protein [Synechococcus sp. BO 8801]|uniref:oxygenase MpaB family protein n=1 Tax=Synechococcus sp. BO 8801 TaxID=169670 RepID=UPI001E61B4EE|nr:oxygenase MpaB family protein [Synechococcus sp. BO 8801]